MESDWERWRDHVMRRVDATFDSLARSEHSILQAMEILDWYRSTVEARMVRQDQLSSEEPVVDPALI